MRASVVLFVGLVLAGCATRYQDMGPTGGVNAAPITNDLYRISARGNLYTDNGTIQDYVLLKAAETTVAAGRTHFAIVGKQDGSPSRGLYSRSALGAKDEHYGFGLIDKHRYEPGEDLMVRLLPTTLSAEDKAEAIDARQIIANVGARVQRPQP